MSLGNLGGGGAARRRRRAARERRWRSARSTRCAFARSGPAQPVSRAVGRQPAEGRDRPLAARDCRCCCSTNRRAASTSARSSTSTALMGALAREGRALVVVSSDLRELMLICDRIGVMSAGSMTGVFERDELDAGRAAGRRVRGLREARRRCLHEADRAAMRKRPTDNLRASECSAKPTCRRRSHRSAAASRRHAARLFELPRSGRRARWR